MRFFVMAFVSLFLSDVSAQTLELKRESRNVYIDRGAKTVVFTRFCSAFAMYEDAALSSDRSKIAFLGSSSEVCDVKGVYQRADISPGNYRVTVSHEEDDWYEITALGAFVKTNSCYEYVYFQEAMLSLNAYGGSLTFFNSKSKCNVEGVYQKRR